MLNSLVSDFLEGRRSDFTDSVNLKPRCVRLVVRQTERGEDLDADVLGRAVVERYDRAMMRGHEAPGVVPLRRD